MEEDSSNKKASDTPVGILRIDFAKPRRLSAEFKSSQGEPTSPQPSIDRLSVTFAEDSVRSDSSTKCNYFNPSSNKMDTVNFPSIPTEREESDPEDYSASVNAIIQRRTSTRRSRRRSGRRASSPFSPDVLPGTENSRRRSSVFTTSSGETAITMDENLVAEATQEEIFENIKLHKEVLSNVKMQPWNMRKKLKLVVQAKAYIKKHEGVLQERLAQSHSTRDMLATWNIYFVKKWQHWRREMLNLSMWFIPWELKIKEIESHFGSVVASYFIFLRWLFWVNLVIAIVLISFVAIPEMLTADSKKAGDRKFTLKEEKYNATNFLTLWDFEGVFKYSPLFYGWYTNNDTNDRGYRLPFAYFVTGLVVYAYSFFATLRKMAENSRMSKLSEKDDECIFSWKLFTAWDYMIGNPETAHNRVASIIMGFKEALLEEAEKKREARKWKVIFFRILVNTVVLGLLTFSAFAVVKVVQRSTEKEANSTVWRKNEITIVMSLITLSFPMMFEVLGLVEQYHPRKQLRLQLARIMVLNLLNLYSLIIALFGKISVMTSEQQKFNNLSCTEFDSITPTTTGSDKNTVLLSRSEMDINLPVSANLISDIALNMSNSAYPRILQIMEQFVTQPTTELKQSNTTDYDYYMEYLDYMSSLNDETENETVSNIPLINDTFSNISFINETLGNYTNFNFTDLTDFFVDYLTYIIQPFTSNETATLQNVTNVNMSEVLDHENASYIVENTFETFKTAIMSLLNNISRQYNETVDNELLNIYKDVNTTIAWFQETTVPVLPNVTTFSSYDVSSSTTLLPFQPTVLTYSTTALSVQPIVANYSMCSRLRSLCWETMFGQELIKLTVMDLIMTILSTLAVDFFRGIFVRGMNRCWCWDLEKKFPQYGDFKVAENILHLVNNQGMVWMGMFFSPGLVVLNVIKLHIMMYFRAWAVLTCNVPHEVIFRASRSNNFYYALLLMMLFLCVLPVGYAIVWIKPSYHCGPFSNYQRIFHIFTETIRNTLPETFQKALDYIASPGIVIPLLVLLILIIYYLISLTGALREANEDLKIQLRRERTEERRKMFQIVDRRRGGSGESNELANTPFAKWKKILGTLPTGKSFDDTPRQESEDIPQAFKQEKVESKNKDFFSKLIKKALGKTSTSEDEEPNIEDGTDTELHESLPDDSLMSRQHKPVRPSLSWGNSDFSSAVNKIIKKNRGRIESFPSESTDSVEMRPIQTCDSILPRCYPFDLKTRQQKKYVEPVASTSKASRQDSGSSVWSDNIPVITISKTESAENILDGDGTTVEEKTKSKARGSDFAKFKPKIKCALKKQSTEIDEDTVCHFNRELERNLTENKIIKAVAEEDVATASTVLDYPHEQSNNKFDDQSQISSISGEEKLGTEDMLTDKSSSDDTEYKEVSVNTVLKSPHVNEEK